MGEHGWSGLSLSPDSMENISMLVCRETAMKSVKGIPSHLKLFSTFLTNFSLFSYKLGNFKFCIS